MPVKIAQPTQIEAAGTKPKIIKEYIGRINNQEGRLSLARMSSPAGWEEPGQRPEFDEYTLVLSGELVVEVESGEPLRIGAGEAVWTRPGEWIRYRTETDCEYVAICLPAFSMETVHRDDA